MGRKSLTLAARSRSMATALASTSRPRRITPIRCGPTQTSPAPLHPLTLAHGLLLLLPPPYNLVSACFMIILETWRGAGRIASRGRVLWLVLDIAASRLSTLALPVATPSSRSMRWFERLRVSGCRGSVYTLTALLCLAGSSPAQLRVSVVPLEFPPCPVMPGPGNLWQSKNAGW